MASEEFLLLLDGRVVAAVTTMFQSVFGMWFITGLFFVFKALVYYRTGNLNLGFAISILFLGGVSGSSMLIGTGIEFLDSPAFRTVVAIAVFELAGVLYSIIWKKWKLELLHKKNIYLRDLIY